MENNIIETMKELVRRKFYPDDTIDTISVEWYSYVLGNCKANIISTKDEGDDRKFTITYSQSDRLFYCDEYEIKSRVAFGYMDKGKNQ